jgi:hypothetical protein
MPQSKTPTVSLEEAKARFEEWRQNRQGKAAIPDELWATAVEVARKEGVSRTSTELHVEWNHLKRRMAAASGASRRTATAGIRGVGSAGDTVACGVHDRTGRPPGQAADLRKGCSRFVSGRAQP